jgi:cytochrome c oxidase subunit 3
MEARMAEPLGAYDPSRALPVGSVGRRPGGYWGMWTLIGTEAALFGYLIFSYLYLYSQSGTHWPPEGLPKIAPAAWNTVVLLSSSGFVWLCERFVVRGRPKHAACAMLVAIVLGIVFVGVQLNEWRDHPYGPSTHLYGSLYFTITGFHMAHVIVGLVVLTLLLVWTALAYFDEARHAPLTIGGMYWHFVDIVWLFIFSTLYLSPFVL